MAELVELPKLEEGTADPSFGLLTWELRSRCKSVPSSIFFWAIYRSKAIQREILEIDSQFQSG
jgi:hypothetical protein